MKGVADNSIRNEARDLANDALSLPVGSLSSQNRSIMRILVVEDDKKIALFAAGVLNFRAISTVGDLRENVTLTTSEHGYTWVNPLQIWALGTVDIATCEVHIAGYAV